MCSQSSTPLAAPLSPTQATHARYTRYTRFPHILHTKSCAILQIFGVHTKTTFDRNKEPRVRLFIYKKESGSFFRTPCWVGLLIVYKKSDQGLLIPVKVHTCRDTSSHRYFHAQVCSCIGMFMHMYLHAHVRSFTGTLMDRYVHADVHSSRCTHMQMYIHADVLSCTG